MSSIFYHDNLCKIDPDLFLHMAYVDSWIAEYHDYEHH